MLIVMDKTTTKWKWLLVSGRLVFTWPWQWRACFASAYVEWTKYGVESGGWGKRAAYLPGPLMQLDPSDCDFSLAHVPKEAG